MSCRIFLLRYCGIFDIFVSHKLLIGHGFTTKFLYGIYSTKSLTTELDRMIFIQNVNPPSFLNKKKSEEKIYEWEISKLFSVLLHDYKPGLPICQKMKMAI